MNDINSILIEGMVVEKPAIGDEENRAVFVISNRHFYMQDGEQVEAKTAVTVVVRGKKLYDEVRARAALHRYVRVVGRIESELYYLAGEWLPRIVVVAEHVEFTHRFGRPSS